MTNEIQIPTRYIFAAVAVVIIIGLFFVLKTAGIATGFATKNIGESEAKANLLDFFAMQVPGSNVEIISTLKHEDFYAFNVSLDGEPYPIYVTRDGKYMTIDVIPLTNN